MSRHSPQLVTVTHVSPLQSTIRNGTTSEYSRTRRLVLGALDKALTLNKKERLFVGTCNYYYYYLLAPSRVTRYDHM